MGKELNGYTVTMRFQHPAWDEKNGIEYDVTAKSKQDACASARRRAYDDGHTGRRYFTAVKKEQQ